MMQGAQQINNVVIVGGGTAGWMAAASLAKLIARNDINITLIESDEISTVGVGEATIPPLLLMNQYLGINEQEFLAETRGTFKLGISFENWKNLNENYIHAFGSLGQDSWASGFQQFWKKGFDYGIEFPIGDYCMELQAAKAGKFAHMREGNISYAYHIDAGLYARFLRRMAEANGAKRVEGKIIEVNQHPETQFIESVRLSSGELISGDLFIDCSGFRGLLIEQTLRTGFEDWGHWLPCDSAVAVQTESVREPVPYTRAIAHGAGWQWQIPLQHRVGNGMVYCSRYISDDEARQTLLNNIEGQTITEPKLIKYKTGQRLKYWNKNCIALGLASGFIEPLESTSIHLIQRGITRLIQLFPTDSIKQCDIDEYNDQMRAEVLNIRDFIILHYHITNRTDTPFWRSCRHMEIPDTLAHRIKLFEETGRVFIKPGELFVQASWVQVMIGQGLLPKSSHALVNGMKEEELRGFLNGIRNTIKQGVDRMPSHQTYLDYYCKAKPWDQL